MPSSEHAVARLSLYRRFLDECRRQGEAAIFSHELAERTGVSAAQVRRDLMGVGYAGSPRRGYRVDDLAHAIDEYLDAPEGQRVAVVGIGNLGRALLAFFSGRRSKLKIVAAFDADPTKVDRVTHGCRCHAMNRLPEVIAEQNITLAIIAVPAASAPDVAQACVAAGVRGLLNFAPAPLAVPEESCYSLDVDLTTSLEMVAFFARQVAEQQEPSTP